MRSKLKNYLTGNTVEKTFRAGESVESALVERSPTQFTYADGEDVSIDADGSVAGGLCMALVSCCGGLLCSLCITQPSCESLGQ